MSQASNSSARPLARSSELSLRSEESLDDEIENESQESKQVEFEDPMEDYLNDSRTQMEKNEDDISLPDFLQQYDQKKRELIKKLKVMSQNELQQQVVKAADVVYQLAVWEGQLLQQSKKYNILGN